MNIQEFKSILEEYPEHALTFVLPDADRIPAHAHITEVGRIDKRFIDCGGTVRQLANCTLQAWVAEDTNHRLRPGKLAQIIGLAAPLLGTDELPVEIEYEDCSITQFPVLGAEAKDGELVFTLGEKHTDCLAKELCLPNGCCATPSNEATSRCC
jgi:hypothetical protein